MSRAWFEVAFDDLYLELYAHRDEAEADQAVAWIERALAPHVPAGLASGPVLDLACGAGRHLAALARRGARGVGIDLSPHLLARARAARVGAPLVRGDIRRLPFAAGRFALALSMFTSLGYFEHDRDHEAVLSEVARVLSPRGFLVVDYLNADLVSRTLAPLTEREVGEYRVIEARRIDATRGRVLKEVHVHRRAGGPAISHHVESVALWNRAALESRLELAGFRVRAAAGDYAGGAFGIDAPRLLLLAQLAAAREIA